MAKSKNQSEKSLPYRPPKPKQVGWGIDQEKYDKARKPKKS